MTLIAPSAFPDAGLYLLFPDGHRLDLTEDVISAAAQRFLGDPQRLPDHIRAAAEYQPCSICPQRNTAKICHAIVATLPFVDDVDRYVSNDKVTAVYRERGSAILEVSQTNMVEALKYLSTLSLMNYCEVGRKYFPYFQGVSPPSRSLCAYSTTSTSIAVVISVRPAPSSRRCRRRYRLPPAVRWIAYGSSAVTTHS